jgi:PAS domain S-box-containing protein
MSFAFRGLRDRSCRVVQRPFGDGTRKQGRVWSCDLAVFVLVLSFLLIQSVAGAQVKPIRRILILNEVNPSYPAIPIINGGIQTALSNSPYHLEFYSEYFDTGLFPDPAAQQDFRDFYIRKYQNRQPDVIISVGISPLRFMQEVHQSAFPGVPIVFCLPVGAVPSARELGSDFTGVESDMAPAKTLEIALRLQPGTEHVVVVAGVSDFDKQQLALARRQIKGVTDHLEITYMTDMAVPDLLEHLKHLPRHTLVLLLSIARDTEGTPFKSNEIGPLVAAAANAPVFSLYDVYLGHGEVGGYLSSLSEQGKVAGGMALRILRGGKPQDIPKVKGVNTYMFDWRAVKRWGLKETEIPPGSIVLNRQLTMWESYEDYVIGGISLIILQAVLINGLLWQRARRRRVESELAISNDRLRMTVEVGGSVGWDWDLKSGRDRRFGDLQTIFGITSDTYSGDIEDFRRQVHPADQGMVWSAFADAQQSQRPVTTEFRVVRTEGTVRWITARGKFYYTDHCDAVRMLGMAVDITERKQAEEALTSLSGRLIEAQEEERRRIAREVHDDYSQRLAILSIDLESLAKDIGHLDPETGQCLRELGKSASELGVDLHRLSHRLHSSALETLGLVAGLRTFCKEFRDQQGIQVDFTHNDVPSGISKDASLCLFRILQEGLRNVKKHSGSDRAEVRLEVVGESLHLSIADWGRGFDIKVRSREAGIGIRSMEERLRLLGGNLHIQARPMEGTRIDAWLPFTIVNEQAS